MITSERRHTQTEPKEISEIIAIVMADLTERTEEGAQNDPERKSNNDACERQS